jgi:ATP-dependent DNA helicase RecQ
VSRATEVLSSVFGFPEFRGDQKEIVEHLVAGGDCLVLMPTGAGKSLCYQVPAIVRPGTGIVVSPLIALMQDQVEALRQYGVKAAFLNSSLDARTAREVEGQLVDGTLDLLYVAPERALQPRFLDLLSRTTPALFAIDEAHCVSMWGHDFRPEYRQLRALHQLFPGVPRIALTATADGPTRKDIADHLELLSARMFVASFDRPNITYRVTQKTNPNVQLMRFLADHRGESGIVYRLSRKKVEDTAESINAEGRVALPYHAGLDANTRRSNQDRFIREDGIVMVATVAFGMGIDKPDVRFVAHLDLPKSLEAYYQETGRAGRDGLPSEAWMTYGTADIFGMQQLIESGEARGELAEQRRRVEKQKLFELLGYAESIGCRRQSLLAHFEESHPGNCNNCDNCLNPPKSRDGTVDAQKALSCAIRTGERFGAGHLIDVLLGKTTDKVASFAHGDLSTFGIGTDLTESQWRAVFRQLVALGLLVADPSRHGALRLTEEARPVLRGDREITLREDVAKPKRERRKASSPVSFGDVTPEQIELYERLRAMRKELADEQGVPAYVIFHDATLREIIEKRPQTLEAFAAIGGVGASKLERYGPRFLEVLTT